MGTQKRETDKQEQLFLMGT